jgi:thiamine biosynthesis lipoprotein
LDSVTLLGDSGAAIDPLTTALFVLGQERGMKLVKKLGYEAIFVDAKGTVTATPGIVLPKK